MVGFGGTEKGKKKQSAKYQKINFQKWFNQAIYFHQTGKFRNAESIYKKLIDAGSLDPAVFCNLGVIYKNKGNIKDALELYEQAMKIAPDDSKILANVGNLYRDMGNLHKALQFTLKSLRVDPGSSTVYLNLSRIHREMGDTDQALSATIQSIKLDEKNIEAHKNLQSLSQDIQVTASTAEDVEKAFEILLDREDFFHRKLCSLFVQLFLEKIRIAGSQDVIISDDNQAFKELASDWRFRKSLTLLTPPNQEIEIFLTRLRKELLIDIGTSQNVSKEYIPLLEALAIQCFLNEYVYYKSDEENNWIEVLAKKSRNYKEAFNLNFAILSCYFPAHQIIPFLELKSSHASIREKYRDIFDMQIKEVKEENRIKSYLHENKQITNSISRKVKDMYEENPYPRYRFSDYTHPSLAQPIAESISREMTISKPYFSDKLQSSNSTVKILIAGCGTGNQIINASRYSNVEITAIDISKSSLAYAVRKSREYNMNNIRFENLDILDVGNLQDEFDVIECSGVLHHMDKPYEGLAALSNQLKAGGYIKIGLYSSLARIHVSLARNVIQQLGIEGNPEGIRNFRRRIFNGEFQEFKDIAKNVNDFYSLSECRDLCFHVQEHQFTPESLNTLLNSANLMFCGFMLPQAIHKAYRQDFPSDMDGTSLSNWQIFEEKNKTIFQSMYQFWAYKHA